MLKAVGIVACFQDVAMMGNAIQAKQSSSSHHQILAPTSQKDRFVVMIK